MIRGAHPVVQALLASLFTWGVTALGASLVFCFKSESKKLLDASLGFAAGVMTAASFWSLLAPSIEISEQTMGSLAFIPVSIGFLCGAAFVFTADRLLGRFGFANETRTLLGDATVSATNGEAVLPMSVTLKRNIDDSSEGTALRKRRRRPKSGEMVMATEDGGVQPPTTTIHNSDHADGCSDGEERGAMTIGGDVEMTAAANGATTGDAEAAVVDPLQQHTALSWRRIVLLITAITVHNIPEGLAVGVGFGAVGKTPSANFESAFNLALGIGLQNFPEGLAVSLPLAGFGFGKLRSFWYGQLSGMVEPAAALLGATAVLVMEPMLPYALSFAAGAMIFVVFDDIVPEAQQNGNGRLASLTVILGFVVMMALDVGLG